MRSIASFLFPVVLMAGPLPAQDASAQTILDQHLAAIGGTERLKALGSLRIAGRQVLMPASLELPMVIEQRRPNLQRVELTVQGMTEVQTFDGRTGWIKTPWAANKEAVPMRPDEVKALSERDFDTPYLGWQAKGWQADYLGSLTQEGRNLQRVQLTIDTSQSIIGTFDAKTFMELQRERVYRELGNETRVVTVFSDYREVQGLRFPFLIISRAAYRGGRMKLLVDRIEIEPQLPEQRFAKP
jgi:hypothetical protein